MKDWKELRKAAESQGWRVVRSNGDHYKWYGPDGRTLLVSGSTASDHRAIKNHRAMLRRAGFNG